MKPSIRVLSVGLKQCLDMAYGSLLLGRPCEITRVMQRGELDAMQADEDYDVVVLGEALSQATLIEVASLTRRRWPQAQILAVSGKPLEIDDALYDDRILPGYGAKVLAAEVLRLMDEHGRQRKGITSRWEC
jgi:hypothetical protein